MMDQEITSEEVARLVQSEVESFRDLPLRERFVPFIVPPYLQMRTWGRLPCQEVPCWVVTDFQIDGFQGRGVGAAYCRSGHGENGFYWNLVFLRDEDYLDAGNNNCYRTLEELATDSGYCK